MLSCLIIRRWLIGIAAVAVVVVAVATFGSGPAAEARLIAFEALPLNAAGETCEWQIAAPQSPSYAAPGAAVQLPPATHAWRSPGGSR